MNILVTGSKGQLGSEINLLSIKYSDFRYFFTDIEELDIKDFSAIEEYISEKAIDCIVNCAAYTAVDKAETETELAENINIMAASNLSKICSRHNIQLIHISTDYVFDGRNHKPYIETDKTNPLSVYGRTKLEGEKEIIRNCSNALIIRTSWLYSTFGNNFVKSIIRYARERGKLNVVYDQVGTPTNARDLGNAILEIISTINQDSVSGELRRATEIYHYSNEGVCSWYDFAKTIAEMKNIKCIINPIETKDYPTPATRPHYSVFSKEKIKKHFNLKIPYWRDSLADCLKGIENG